MPAGFKIKKRKNRKFFLPKNKNSCKKRLETMSKQAQDQNIQLII
jgi:hypothetical protein